MTIIVQTLALCSLLSATPKTAAEKADPARDEKTDVRRTERVKPQRDAGTGLTPMDQNEVEADVKMTQRVRQAVMADDRLSFTAKNVKIITQGRKVTLRGAVNTQTEHDVVCALAAQIAGRDAVTDELEVPTAKAN